MLLGATLLLLCVVGNSNEDGDWLKCKPKPGCSIARCDPRPGHWFENVDKLNDYSILCQKNEASDDPGMVTDYADVLEELAKLKGRLERSEREGSETKVEMKILEKENAKVKSQLKEMESRMEKERNETKSELKSMRTNHADVLKELENLKGRLESERKGSEMKAVRSNLDPEFQSWYKAGNGNLYKFYPERVTRAHAKARCASKGAILVTAGYRDTSVRRELEIYTNLPEIWLGLNDLLQEGTFVWEDGITSSGGDINWNSGEPNNHSGNEDCVDVFNSGGKWAANDNSCSAVIAYLCEKII